VRNLSPGTAHKKKKTKIQPQVHTFSQADKLQVRLKNYKIQDTDTFASRPNANVSIASAGHLFGIYAAPRLPTESWENQTDSQAQTVRPTREPYLAYNILTIQRILHLLPPSGGDRSCNALKIVHFLLQLKL